MFTILSAGFELRLRGMLFAVGLLLLPCWSLAAPPEGYRFLSYGDAMAEAARLNKPVFLYFGRYGCSVCLRMHQEVFTDPKIKARFNDHFVLAYVDTESGNRVTLPNNERITEMQLAARVRILGTPTFFFLGADQAPVMKVSGFQSAEEMLKYDSFIEGGHYRTLTFKDYLSQK